MKLVRFSEDQTFSRDRTARFGILKNGSVQDIIGTPFSNFRLGDILYSLDQVKLEAPVTPSKVVAVGLNYRDHADELKMSPPEEPLLFLKPSTSVIGPEESIIYPGSSQRIDYEAELAVVIRSVTKDVEAEEATEHILGFTCANDVTARDLQKKDGQWTRSKSFDTFSPLGPWIETELEPGNLKIELLLNGEIRQSSNTSKMIFPIESLVSFVSKIMTLLPGDIILTGTPPGVGPMRVGDMVEARIEGIGSLKNDVRYRFGFEDRRE